MLELFGRFATAFALSINPAPAIEPPCRDGYYFNYETKVCVVIPEKDRE